MSAQELAVPPFQTVCKLADLVPMSGIAVLSQNEQVAIFYLPDSEEQVFAIGNFDPIGGANVLSRGIVGDVGGTWSVASPLYKQHFCLTTGICLEQPEHSVPVYSVKVDGQCVCLSVVPLE